VLPDSVCIFSPPDLDILSVNFTRDMKFSLVGEQDFFYGVRIVVSAIERLLYATLTLHAIARFQLLRWLKLVRS